MDKDFLKLLLFNNNILLLIYFQNLPNSMFNGFTLLVNGGNLCTLSLSVSSYFGEGRPEVGTLSKLLPSN